MTMMESHIRFLGRLQNGAFVIDLREAKYDDAIALRVEVLSSRYLASDCATYLTSWLKRSFSEVYTTVDLLHCATDVII